MNITIFNENPNKDRRDEEGTLENKQRKVIFILISDWLEQIDKKIQFCNELKISEIIIKPRFSFVNQLITIDITFNFLLPSYSFAFSREKTLDVIRKDKAISKEEFNDNLNKFLTELIHSERQKASRFHKSLEKALEES